jgi:hypothetical protein
MHFYQVKADTTLIIEPALDLVNDIIYSILFCNNYS